MAIGVITPGTTGNLQTAVGFSGLIANDDVLINRGFEQYTAGLDFTSKNLGSVWVDHGFGGSIGGEGDPWKLHSDQSGKIVALFGSGTHVYISPGAQTIRELRCGMKRVHVSGEAGGTVAALAVLGGLCVVGGSLPTLTEFLVEDGQGVLLAGGNAVPTLRVGPRGLARVARDFDAAELAGDVYLDATGVTPAGAVEVHGRLHVIQCGAWGASSTLTLAPGAVLDLTKSNSQLSLQNFVHWPGSVVRKRKNGPGIAVAGTETAKYGGYRVEEVG